MSKAKVSDYIDRLKRGLEPKLPAPHVPLTDDAWIPFPERVEFLVGIGYEPEEEPKPAPPVLAGTSVAKRETIVPREFVDMVEDGYYAAQAHEGAHITFIRISRPKHGKYNGCIKVQKQLGSGFGIRLVDELIFYPDGRVSVYSASIEEPLMLVIADKYGCARRYAKERKMCARCNAELTDSRSRKYGIGPECVKHWPWMIALVDEEEELNRAA